jgi:hypothetical protein
MNIDPQHGSSSSKIQLVSDNGSANPSKDDSRMINLSEARKILGVSPNKMSKLVTDGTLRFELDPLDRRVKLVLLREVEKLRQFSRRA